MTGRVLMSFWNRSIECWPIYKPSYPMTSYVGQYRLIFCNLSECENVRKCAKMCKLRISLVMKYIYDKIRYIMKMSISYHLIQDCFVNSQEMII